MNKNTYLVIQTNIEYFGLLLLNEYTFNKSQFSILKQLHETYEKISKQRNIHFINQNINMYFQKVQQRQKQNSKLFLVRIILQFNMFYDSQDFQMLELMESSINKPVDFFKQILDNNSEHLIRDNRIEFCSQQRIQSQKISDPRQVSPNQIIKPIVKEQTKMDTNPIECIEAKIEQTDPLQEDNIKQIENEVDCRKSFLVQKQDRSKKSTRCYQTIEEEQVLLQQKVEKEQQIVLNFSCSNANDVSDQQCPAAEKKVSKLKRKIGKFILKQKSFGKTLKLSFPKKIVEMFINHYSKFPIESKQIQDYNNNLRIKLKQSKKNDYTFEKQVSQILGDNKQDSTISDLLLQDISRVNRHIFNQIIRTTMKQQVIMRDKIAKNRQLYMIQLKVYALRCRSHRLSKKGTYK